MTSPPLTRSSLHKVEMEYHGKFGHALGRIHYIALLSIMAFFTHTVVWKAKLRHLIFLSSKVSNAVFNIWLVTLIKPYFILLLIMMYKMPLDLHEVVIKLNSMQPGIV